MGSGYCIHAKDRIEEEESAAPVEPKFLFLGDTFLPPSERSLPRLLTQEQAEEFLPYLEKENRKEWRMIYNNYSSYGNSIRQFTKHVCNRGPTVLAVRDTNGATFGCYAADSWRVHNEFYSNGRCFLFRIIDGKVERIAYSGNDTNFMYYNLGKETMPNGLAMGGRHDVGAAGWFAFYIDDNLKFGESHAHTRTFERQPCVASEERFQVDLLEVIRVSIPTKKEEEMLAEMMAVKKSALLTNPDARAVLDAVGKEKCVATAGVKATELGGTEEDEGAVL